MIGNVSMSFNKNYIDIATARYPKTKALLELLLKKTTDCLYSVLSGLNIVNTCDEWINIPSYISVIICVSYICTRSTMLRQLFKFEKSNI